MSGWLNWRVVGGDFFFMIGDIGGGISCISRCFSRSFCSCSKAQIENCHKSSPAILVKAIPVLSPSRLPTAFALSSSASSAPSASAGSRPTRARPSRLGGSRGQGGIQRAAEPVIMQWACQMVNRYALHSSQTYITLIGRKDKKLFIY